VWSPQAATVQHADDMAMSISLLCQHLLAPRRPRPKQLPVGSRKHLDTASCGCVKLKTVITTIKQAKKIYEKSTCAQILKNNIMKPLTKRPFVDAHSDTVLINCGMPTGN
jgi:hypothetical protein